MNEELKVLRGRVVLEDRVVEDGVVVLEGASIRAVGPMGGIDEGGPELVEAVATTPRSELVLLPGLVDVHCHGGGGASFPDATTPEEVLTAVLEHRRHGTTSVVASCVTAAPAVLRRSAALLAGVADDGEIAGIHFEGPFVSEARCGAQDPAHILDPDPLLTADLLELGRGHVVTMTLAPEKEGAYGPGSVAEVLITHGALPSWGHTDSDPAHARAALDASRAALAVTQGVRSSRPTVTHLFNGMRPLHHRDPGPIAEFLSAAARGNAVVELICDGVHVDPSVVRDVYEMVGRDRCVLVTDAMAAAGMADGEYQLGPQAVTVRGGVARLSGGTSIAGGTSHLLDCVRVAVTRAGIPLVDAVHMASRQGARILGDETVGRLRPGGRADVVAVDADLRPVTVWRAGEVVA